MKTKDFIKELEKHTSLTYNVEEEDEYDELYVSEIKLKSIEELFKDIERLKESIEAQTKVLKEAINEVDKKTPITRIDGNVQDSILTGVILLTGKGVSIYNNTFRGLFAMNEEILKVDEAQEGGSEK